jgi:ribosome-associated protein
MDELQALGEALVRVDPRRLSDLDLPERLIEAIGETRRITKHEARRRQLQFIGRLMREVDASTIRARLAEWNDAPNREKARLHAIERWRERLLADPEALGALCAEHPSADRPGLAALIDSVHRERMHSGPPRAYRELFRALGTVLGDLG